MPSYVGCSLIICQQGALWTNVVQHVATRTDIQSLISFGMADSDVMYAAYGGSDEQHVQHVCSCSPHFLHYFRPAVFVVSLSHRISFLSSDLAQLIQETWRHHASIPYHSEGSKLPVCKISYYTLHNTRAIPTQPRQLRWSSRTHLCQSNANCEGIKHQKQTNQESALNSPQLRGHMAQIPWATPRSEAGCRL